MKRLSIHAKQRFKTLENQLMNLQPNANGELLHKIRLEIKKIKALINLTEFCVKRFKADRYYVPFRTIFRKAGRIRQAEVQEKLSLAYGIDSKERMDLPDDGVSLSFHADAQFILSLHRVEEKLIDSFGKVKPSCFKKYLNRKKRELKQKLFPSVDHLTLHKTRKIVKEILYLSPITKKSKKRLDPFYEALQSLIGQWHDKQTVMRLLKGNKNLVHLKKLKEECRVDVRNLEELVHQFYN